MEHIAFLQDSLMRAAERLLSSGAEFSRYLELIGRKKAGALTKKIVGKKFMAGEILSEGDWEYKYCKENMFKAICVKCVRCPYNSPVDICSYGSMSALTVTVHFFADPNVLLASRIKFTDKEIKCLKTIAKAYEVDNGEEVYSVYMADAVEAAKELRDLKHGLYMHVSLNWNFTLEKVTAPNFLERGLRANKVELC